MLNDKAQKQFGGDKASGFGSRATIAEFTDLHLDHKRGPQAEGYPV